MFGNKKRKYITLKLSLHYTILYSESLCNTHIKLMSIVKYVNRNINVAHLDNSNTS
jgi:hypothetical protein